MGYEELDQGKLKKELYLFLIITFAATWIIQLIAFLVAGPIPFSKVPLVWEIVLSYSMFIPAAAAILCMVYFKSSTLTKEAKIILAYYVGYLVLVTLGLIGIPLSFLIPFIAIAGILAVIILNLKREWRESLMPSRLAFGKNLKFYLIIPLIFILILTTSFLLNYFLKFGTPNIQFDLGLYWTYLLVNVAAGFFIIWPQFFGEEYGWRVYLQDRLFTLLGGYRGVLMVGIIWGVWHVPLILCGYNYPGQPVIGSLIFILFTIMIGIFYSYAVLKTGSVWIAVILHLFTNTAAPLAYNYIAEPTNVIYSFGIGLYGIIFIGIFALILLKSKVWGEKNHYAN